MGTTTIGYIGASFRIHSFIPSSPNASSWLLAPDIWSLDIKAHFLSKVRNSQRAMTVIAAL